MDHKFFGSSHRFPLYGLTNDVKIQIITQECKEFLEEMRKDVTSFPGLTYKTNNSLDTDSQS